MNCCTRFPIVAVTAAVVVAGSLAFTQSTKDKTTAPPKTGATTPPAGDMQMPPAPKGWTDEEWASCMKACEEAGTPGKMHQTLAEGAGTWIGDSKMWMAPETEAMTCKITSTCAPIMDGRFVKCDVTGDMMGMPFHGQGTYGYDNVTKKFQCSWIDNMGTTMMIGTGEASSDGKTITWTYNFTCPYTKKPTTMREVQKTTGKDTKTLEMYTIDPKSNKEYKMMEVALTRKPGTGVAAAGSN